MIVTLLTCVFDSQLHRFIVFVEKIRHLIKADSPSNFVTYPQFLGRFAFFEDHNLRRWLESVQFPLLVRALCKLEQIALLPIQIRWWRGILISAYEFPAESKKLRGLLSRRQ